jgi:hypothetical protein
MGPALQLASGLARAWKLSSLPYAWRLATSTASRFLSQKIAAYMRVPPYYSHTLARPAAKSGPDRTPGPSLLHSREAATSACDARYNGGGRSTAHFVGIRCYRFGACNTAKDETLGRAGRQSVRSVRFAEQTVSPLAALVIMSISLRLTFNCRLPFLPQL